MRRLFPAAGPLDEVTAAAAYDADRPAPEGRPWVTLSMVSSVDGAAATAGTSGGIGGAGDHEAFMALRALADVVLVASGTVRAERYRRPSSRPHVRDARRSRGQPDSARLAVVSGSLGLDLRLPLFVDAPADPDRRPLVLHPPGSPTEPRAALAEVAVLVEVAAGRDDRCASPDAVLSELYARGAKLALAEGGPRFNGQLLAADVVDELCVTIDPVVVGGSEAESRIVVGGDRHDPRAFRTVQVLEADGVLLLRLVRDRSIAR